MAGESVRSEAIFQEEIMSEPKAIDGTGMSGSNVVPPLRTRSRTKPLKILVYVLVLLGALIMFFAQPYFEAKAYNKHRAPDQPEATYWDAMFSELRVNTR